MEIKKSGRCDRDREITKKWRRINRQIRTILRLRNSLIIKDSPRTHQQKQRILLSPKTHSPFLRGHTVSASNVFDRLADQGIRLNAGLRKFAQ